MMSRLEQRHQQRRERRDLTPPSPAPTAPPPVPAPAHPTNTPSTDEIPLLPAPNRRGTAGLLEVLLSRASQSAMTAVDPRFLIDAEAHLPALLRQCAVVGMPLSSHVAYLLATVEYESGFGAARHPRSVPLVEDHAPFRHDPLRDEWTTDNHLTHRLLTAPTQEELLIEYWNVAYGHRVDLGNRPGTNDGYVYRGRGFIPAIGRSAYSRLTTHLQAAGFHYDLDGATWGSPASPLDLVARPDHLRRSHALAARCAAGGLREGLLTGVKLDRFLTPNTTDFVNARRAVRPHEQSGPVAAIARRFHQTLGSWPAILAAMEGTPP